MKSINTFRVGLIILAGMIPVICHSQQLDEVITNELASQGAKRFDIKWQGRVIGASQRGVMAVSDGVTTLTTREGSRIFILHDRKRFPPNEKSMFKGSDAQLKRAGMKLLMASGAKKEEIAEVRVLQQFTQLGESAPGSKRVKVFPAKKSHRTLMVTRKIEGIDVASSRLMLHLDNTGRPAFMELAWPDVAPDVLERAMRYRKMLAEKFEAPAMEGGEMESVRPVVLHSPAVGFYNDATAAIRVIYKPYAKQVGQKAVRYLDEEGRDVVLPRDVDLLKEEAVQRVDRR
jgi:histone H3/H4